MFRRSILFLALAISAPLLAQTRLVKAEVIPVTENIAEDPELAKVIAPARAEIKAAFDVLLTQAPKGLFRGRSGEENLLGYWVADAMRARAAAFTGKDVRMAITNSGGLRANLRPGNVKVADIYEILPFENELMVAELTGAEVIQLLKDGVLRRGGEPVSGVKVTVKGTPAAPEFTVTWEDGTAIDPKATVLFASSDYLLDSGDGIGTFRLARNRKSTGLQLRQVVLDLCTDLGKTQKPVSAPSPGRYTFTPEILEAIRDRRLMKQ